jgi:hypothetical protein
MLVDMSVVPAAAVARAVSKMPCRLSSLITESTNDGDARISFSAGELLGKMLMDPVMPAVPEA